MPAPFVGAHSDRQSDQVCPDRPGPAQADHIYPRDSGPKSGESGRVSGCLPSGERIPSGLVANRGWLTIREITASRIDGPGPARDRAPLRATCAPRWPPRAVPTPGSAGNTWRCWRRIESLPEQPGPSIYTAFTTGASRHINPSRDLGAIPNLSVDQRRSLPRTVEVPRSPSTTCTSCGVSCATRPRTSNPTRTSGACKMPAPGHTSGLSGRGAALSQLGGAVDVW